MFIPLTVRHGYDHKPVATFSLAILVALTNAFAVTIPWIIEVKYRELLMLAAFNRDALHAFNFFTYAFVFPNPWLFVFDMAGLVFFGMAIEARFGAWKTLLIVFTSIAFAAFAQGVYQPHFDAAGMTGGVLGLVGAAFVIYAFSETDIIALVPLPPNWRFGFTFTWTIYLIGIFTAGALAWGHFAPHAETNILTISGLLGGLFMGLASAVILLGGRLPILNPAELDPSTIRRRQDLERREEVKRQLAEDGLYIREEEAGLEALDVMPGVGASWTPTAVSGTRSTDVESRKQGLLKLVMLKEYADLAQTYREFVADFPNGCLASGPQLDIATGLERGQNDELALDAYEKLIQFHPRMPASDQARFRAGVLCAEVPGRERDALRYLEQFLTSDPPRQQVQEAQEAMQKLRLHLSKPPEDVIEEKPPEPAPPAVVAPAFEPTEHVGEEPLKLTGLGAEKREAVSEQKPSSTALPPRAEPRPKPRPEPEFDIQEIVISPAQLRQQLADQAEIEPETPSSHASDFELDGPARAVEIRTATPKATPAVSAAATPVRQVALRPDKKYALLVAPKTVIRLHALAKVFSEYWGQPELLARERVKRQKGMLARKVPQAQAEKLRDECALRGQQLLVVEETPELDFGEAIEVEAIRFLDDTIEWIAGTQRVKTRFDEIRLVGAGMVRVSPTSDRVRCQLSVYADKPHVHLRVWEMLLRNFENPELRDLPPREAMKTIALRLTENCNHAQLTHAFQRTFDLESGTQPLMFDSSEEFDNYNEWNLFTAMDAAKVQLG